MKTRKLMPAHMPTYRRFIQMRRKELRRLMREFHARDGTIMCGAAYLPREAYLLVNDAYTKLAEALKLLEQEVR